MNAPARIQAPDPSLLPVEHPTLESAIAKWGQGDIAFRQYVKSQAHRIANQTVQSCHVEPKLAELVVSVLPLDDIRAVGLKHKRLDHAWKLIREGRLAERLRSECGEARAAESYIPAIGGVA